MALFRFRWLRRLVRKNINPIPEDRAGVWKNRLSIAYMFIAWNALGSIIYLYYSGKADIAKYYGLKTEEDLTKKPAIYYAELIGVKKAQVIGMKGFNKVESYNYNEETNSDNKISET